MQHLKLEGCAFINAVDTSVWTQGTHAANFPVDPDHPGQALLGMHSLQTLDISRSCASRTAIEEVMLRLPAKNQVPLFHAASTYSAIPVHEFLAQTCLLSVRMALLRLIHSNVLVKGSEIYTLKSI